ncbi:MAG: hypothetical protein K1Y02_21875, partial [Candidatus Hydrogenedentes bacterium]|nr:hypothetical protein [Candidatus Hydrogenedentota bacterium]
MRLRVCVTLCVLSAVSGAVAYAEGVFEGKPYTDGDVYADTWVATDAVMRTQPDFATAGPVKPNKWVGIFYWTWHRPNADGPNDNTKLIASANGGATVNWPTNSAP